jgi:hypothetical protein
MSGLTLFCAVAWIASALPARAQVVNLQPVASAGYGEEGWAGVIKASLQWRTGNTNLFQVGTSALLRYQVDLHRLIALGSFDVGYQDGFDEAEVFLRRGLGHLRWQWNALEWLTPEAFVQLGADEFKGIALRALVGAGPRFELVQGPAVNAAVGLTYVYEREHLGSGSGADAGKQSDQHRLSVYLTGSFAIDPLFLIAHTTYYQMLLLDPLDYYILSETSLQVKLHDLVALSIDFGLMYDSKPPDKVVDLDTSLTLGLGVTF